VDSDGQKIKIDFAHIVYIEAAGNYISIVMPDRKIMCYKSMSSVQEILPDNKFVRVHKSYIVSIDNIHSFRGNEIFINHNNTQKPMPIGITYKEKLMKLLRISE
jgi:DNA-binding LytR/AlgR family response regulator